MRTILRPLFLSIALALAGCAGLPQPPHPAAPVAQLPDSTAIRLVARWQEQLCRFIVQEGRGDPAAVAEARRLRSSDVLRPARITFGVLDVEADLPGRDGWDVQGVLVGREAGRYVFVVGIIGRQGYVPTGIQDLRLVGLSAQDGKLRWERYRETFRAFAAQFPAGTDSFVMQAAGAGVTVREQRSGAEWFLPLGPTDRSQANVIPILRASNDEDRCAR
jgi:hypothetical protein